MRPWYATNAQQLLESRQNGMQPEGPVVVSLVGGKFTETTLYLKPDMPVDRVDWRMLVNLEVWLWAGSKASMEWVIDTAWRIAKVRPKELVLRFEHQDYVHDIDCGTGFHRPAVSVFPPVHEFWWTPINVGGTQLGSRIKKSLLAAHPYGEML